MSFFKRLFPGLDKDTSPKVSLEEWLTKESLVPSKDLLTISHSEVQPYRLSPSNQMERFGSPTVSLKVTIIGGKEQEFIFNNEIPSVILNGKYRFSPLGDDYFIIIERKPLFRYFLYQRRS